MIRLAQWLLLIAACSQALAVPVYISGSVDSAKVAQAALAWSEALKITITYQAKTMEPCVIGAITYRVAATQEWTKLMGSANLLQLSAVTGSCRPELNYTGTVILLNPFLGAISQNIYTHELGHALGAHHNPDPLSIMHPIVSAAASITPEDKAIVVGCASTLDIQSINVPSVAGVGATLISERGGEYLVASIRPPKADCRRNYLLPGGDAVLSYVLEGSSLFSVRLNLNQGVWRIKSKVFLSKIN